MHLTSDKEIEAARSEFWRVLAIKERTLEDAWRAAIDTAKEVEREERTISVTT